MEEGDKLNIQMVDLQSQYKRYKEEIDHEMQEVLDSCRFIDGPQVHDFAKELGEALNVKHVVACANGTDALQIAYMALGYKPKDEIIMPSFNYAAAAEAAVVLGLVPVFVDVDPDTFNIDPTKIAERINEQTRAIVGVNLFGQPADLDALLSIAKVHNLDIIEDNAQSLGSLYKGERNVIFSDRNVRHVATTSFFPSKPLACFGDGGALYTDNEELAQRIRSIAHHGQTKKYTHDLIGMNSRLDTLQAAVLRVKLRHMDEFIKARQECAARYDFLLDKHEEWQTPKAADYASHIYSQYTLRIKDGRRDELKQYLAEKDIPSMIYYPKPLHFQKAYASFRSIIYPCPVAEQLSEEVLSIPMHSELSFEQQSYIINTLTEWTTI